MSEILQELTRTVKLSDKAYKIIRMTAIIILLAVIAFSAYKIWSIQTEYKKGTDAYAEIAEIATAPKNVKGPVEDSELALDPDLGGVREPLYPTIDFEALQEMNKDVVGWLYIPDTNISYPIAKGSDNSYYLNHLYNREWNIAGCLFLDCANSRDFFDLNSVVYGHHMKNGTMFYQLDGYKEQDFYEGHRTAWLLTPDKNYQIEFFAGYVANVKDDAWKIDFADGEFGKWCEAQKGRSCFESEAAPGPEDRVITLSTCSYEFDNARFVLFGILRGEDEICQSE